MKTVLRLALLAGLATFASGAQAGGGHGFGGHGFGHHGGFGGGHWGHHHHWGAGFGFGWGSVAYVPAYDECYTRRYVDEFGRLRVRRICE